MKFPRFHNMPDCRADYIHFFGGEPVSTRKIAGFTRWAHIPLNVGQRIIYAIKSARSFCRMAIHAGLNNECVNFTSGKVARVNAFIRLAEKNSPALIASSISPLPLSDLEFLFWRHLVPAVRPFITPLFPGSMAGAAFIRNPAGTALICSEKLGCGREGGFATMTSSHVWTVYIPHSKSKHWQLPWKDYP